MGILLKSYQYGGSNSSTEVTVPNVTFVDDKNDNRYKAYRDSLYLYNTVNRLSTKEFNTAKAEAVDAFKKYLSSKGELKPKDIEKLNDYSHELNNIYDFNFTTQIRSGGEYGKRFLIPNPNYSHSKTPCEYYNNCSKSINEILKNKLYENVYDFGFTKGSLEQQKKNADVFKKLVKHKIKPVGYTNNVVLFNGTNNRILSYPVYKKPVNKFFVKGTPEYDNAQKQIMLKEKGYYIGDIDGIWGNRSKNAWDQYINEERSKEINKSKKEILNNTIHHNTPALPKEYYVEMKSYGNQGHGYAKYVNGIYQGNVSSTIANLSDAPKINLDNPNYENYIKHK